MCRAVKQRCLMMTIILIIIKKKKKSFYLNPLNPLAFKKNCSLRYKQFILFFFIFYLRRVTNKFRWAFWRICRAFLETDFRTCFFFIFFFFGAKPRCLHYLTLFFFPVTFICTFLFVKIAFEICIKY